VPSSDIGEMLDQMPRGYPPPCAFLPRLRTPSTAGLLLPLQLPTQKLPQRLGDGARGDLRDATQRRCGDAITAGRGMWTDGCSISSALCGRTASGTQADR